MLERARGAWVHNWEALMDEPSIVERRIRQALLQDIWRALESQTQGLNTDVRIMRGLQSRMASITAALRGGHGFGRVKRGQEAYRRDPWKVVYRPGGWYDSASVEGLNRALETAIEAIERSQKAEAGSGIDVVS